MTPSKKSGGLEKRLKNVPLLDLPISEQQKKLSTMFSRDTLEYVTSLSLPDFLALPFNPEFKDDSLLLTSLGEYFLPGKLELNAFVRKTMSNMISKNVFETKPTNSKSIKSKGSQTKYWAELVLKKDLKDGLLAAEKSLISSGIVSNSETIEGKFNTNGPVSRYINELYNHHKKGSIPADKISWIQNSTPDKKGMLNGIYEVDLVMSILKSKKIPDVLYQQEKSKSILSIISKTLLTFHKNGLLKDEFDDVLDQLRPKLKDADGLMIVGKSGPFSPNSILSQLNLKLPSSGLVISNFRNYYDSATRLKYKKDIFAHHYTLNLPDSFRVSDSQYDKLSASAKLVLAYSSQPLSEPISLHVKSFRREIHDTFGKNAHNRYKTLTAFHYYKNKLSPSELERFEKIETGMRVFFKDAIPFFVKIVGDYKLLNRD